MRRLLLAAMILGTCACGPKYIEGTQVQDTALNRELVDLIDTYREAIQNRDAGALVPLVSRTYFENAASTAKPEDDYGYEELLKKVLPVLRDNVKKVNYKIVVDGITVVGNEAEVFMEWELTFQYVEGGREGWSTAKDRNKMELVKEGGVWKIKAGL
jgi:hypothetical protein